MTEENKVVEQFVDGVPHFEESSDSGRFTSFIERIERLEEEKGELQKDIREVYAEAKGQGFDVKVMRQIIKLRKLDPADRAENEFLRDEYKKLVGIAD